MSQCYYPNNQILDIWKTDETTSRWWLWPLVFLGLLAGFGTGYWWWTGPDRNAQKATVWIVVDADGDGKFDTTGSGILINSKGFVLTNKHVITDTDGNLAKGKIDVAWLSGTPNVQRMEATVEDAGPGKPALDPEKMRNDWAVLRVVTKDPLPYCELYDRNDFKPEETVAAYGFPRGMETAANSHGPAVTVAKGFIKRVDTSDTGGVIRISHSASTAEGMSGGAVMQQGRIAGLNVQVLTGGKVTANENYAIPAFLLKQKVFDRFGQGK
mgnify:CR=1 FL=1